MQALRMEKTSHSRCEVFDKCPLCGYFKHIAKLPPEPKFKDYAFTGSYTHTSIETWFEKYATLQASGDLNIGELVYPERHFEMTMQEIYSAKCDLIKDKEDDEAILLCLDNFLDFMTRRWYMLKEDLNMIDKFLPKYIEKEYFKVINGVPLHGYVDAIFEDTQIWMFDWKTNKKPKISDEYKRQATRYALLTEGEFEKDITEFYVINLRKKIELKDYRVDITPEMKERQKIELRRVWDLMNGNEFPKKEGDCFFCDHKMRCKAYPAFGVVIEPVQIASNGLLSAPLPAPEPIPVSAEQEIVAGILNVGAANLQAAEPTIEVPKFEMPKPVAQVSALKSALDSWL